MDIAYIIAEERIRQAIKDGDFDKLPGEGKPLNLEDLSHIPEELRQAYRILKNANMITDEQELKRDMATIEELISICTDANEEQRLTEMLTEKRLRFEQLVDKKKMTSSASYRTYQNKIYSKFFY
ncbi:DnaJ family domain-containing protein [Priestia megaterium]|uniref:DnaJ family domain-containing protein n=1 Tax=Priestia megaterium TaxID=1404 RepID=UPI0018670F2D|nr:DUF1992 domain-containing protein [Priestia megaterium]MBE2975730.1 DUF1992 domain-containing protein [Priestia megaterium]MED3929349.1 DUF1992 domain-containing protein [Priestia megaterium]